MSDPVQKLLSSARDNLEETLSQIIWVVGKTCESPIEKAMLEALYVYSLLRVGGWPCHVMPEKTEGWTHATWFIEPQKVINAYRVDFLVTSPDTKKKIVIECDGHDFHERTKEQAEGDRSRDRNLTRDGYCVIRFTGREIWRDPWKCAEEIENQFLTIMHQEAGD